MGAKKLLTKIVVFTLFGLLILSFAVWGIGDIFRGGGQLQAVAKVGDQLVETREFSTAYSREVSQLSRQFGGALDREQAIALGIDQRVLQGLISRTLFDQQALNLGMTVTEDQEKERILREPAFHDEFGSFDPQRFTSVLRNSGLSEGGYRANLRRDVMRGQIVDALIDGASGPGPLAKTLFAYRQEQRRARYVVIPRPVLDAVADPDDSALEEFYQSNQSDFLAPESRSVTMVYLSPDDYLKEVSVSEEELVEGFEQRRDQLTVAERREIDQLVFGNEESAKAAADQAAGGVLLSDIAAADSTASHVNLGLVAKADLLPTLGDAAFALEQGGVSAAVQSPVGWHVLQVIAIQPGKEPVLEEVRETIQRDIALDKAVDTIITYVNTFNDALGSGASMESAAADLGIPVRRIDAITRQGQDAAGQPIADLPPAPVFTQALFDTAEGETSLMTETALGGYFMVRVDAIHAPAPRALAEVRDDVLALWKQNQQAEQAKIEAAALMLRLRDGKTLDTLAAEAGLSVLETEPLRRQGNDPASLPARGLPDEIFGLTLGDAVTVSGQQGEVLAILSEIVPANPAAASADFEQLEANLAQSLQGDLVDQFVIALEREFGVEIFPARMQEALAAY